MKNAFKFLILLSVAVLGQSSVCYASPSGEDHVRTIGRFTIVKVPSPSKPVVKAPPAPLKRRHSAPTR